jgi:hypothetical protein
MIKKDIWVPAFAGIRIRIRAGGSDRFFVRLLMSYGEKYNFKAYKWEIPVLLLALWMVVW